MPRLFALAAFLSAGAAFAQAVDADGNGTYSLAELRAAYPGLSFERFSSADMNGDGAIDDYELRAAEASGLFSS
jgi:hypothetical protein